MPLGSRWVSPDLQLLKCLHGSKFHPILICKNIPLGSSIFPKFSLSIWSSFIFQVCPLIQVPVKFSQKALTIQRCKTIFFSCLNLSHPSLDWNFYILLSYPNVSVLCCQLLTVILKTENIFRILETNKLFNLIKVCKLWVSWILSLPHTFFRPCHPLLLLCIYF